MPIKNFEDDPADVFRGLNFDAVTCSHFIEHMHDPVPTIEFLSTRIAKNGRLYLEWPHEMTERLPGRLDLVAEGHALSTLRFNDDPTHIAAYSMENIQDLLEENGFAIESAGRICLDYVAEELRNHGKSGNDEVFTTLALWAHLGWAQYLVAYKM